MKSRNIIFFIAYIQFILVLDKWFVKVYNQNNIIKVYKGKFDENFSEKMILSACSEKIEVVESKANILTAKENGKFWH